MPIPPKENFPFLQYVRLSH